jgi:hypothetical protein
MFSEKAVKQFASLFQGNPYFRAVVRVSDERNNGKMKSTVTTVSEPVNEGHYRRHLEGEERYGCVLLQMDQTVTFGAIDLDVYGDAAYITSILQWVEHFRLPLIPCRTKSGGLHLYLFLAEPTPAKEVREILHAISAEIGCANYKGKDAEIFPKENTVNFVEGGTGSNITLPYFNAGDADCATYMMNFKMEPMTLDVFLLYASEKRTTVPVVTRLLKARKEDVGDFLKGAPPCLQSVFALVKAGHQAGRNDILRQFTAYFQKRYGDYEAWSHEVDAFNTTYFTEPLSQKELQSTVLKDRPQHYTCTKAPFSSHCNRGKCLQEEYGITQSHGDLLKISYIEKVLTDPAIWRLETSSGKLALTTSQLDNLGEFRKACMEQLSFRPNLKSEQFQEILNVAMQTVNHVIPPDELSRFFPLLDALREYFFATSVNGVMSTNLADLVRNRPVHKADERVVLFNSDAFLRFKSRKKVVDTQELFEFNRHYEITLRVVDLSHLSLSVPLRCSAIAYSHVEAYLVDRQERHALALRLGKEELEDEVKTSERRAF